MKQFLRDYFTFNKRERHGIAVLVMIILLQITYLHYADIFLPPPAEELPEDVPAIPRQPRTQNIVQNKPWRHEVSGYDKFRKRRAFSGARNRTIHVPVEINAADSSSLVSIYGIGPVYASRILKYRSLLGGFVSVEQLREVYGIDSAAYERIRPGILVNDSLVARMDLNTVTPERLRQHPYISPVVATALCRFRQHHGAYSYVDDILKLDLVTDELYVKIAPYLDVP